MPKNTKIEQHDSGIWRVYAEDKLVAQVATKKEAKDYLAIVCSTDIAGRSLTEWETLAQQDDCFDHMVPSDLRLLIAALRRKA
jgi:hypothetical protein